MMDERYCWTGQGQTNFLLGRFAWFGRNCLGLTGQSLVDYIVDRARQSPGYEQYCRHQTKIEHRARDWANSAERGATQGSSQQQQSKDQPTVNQNVLKAEKSQQRIRQAMQLLQKENRLPTAITQRLVVLEKEFGICRRVLYKYQSCWHPKFWVDVASVDPHTAEPTNTEGEMTSQELAECPKPLLIKGCEKFYTYPYMKLFVPAGGEKKMDFRSGNFSATRNQAFPGPPPPENEKIEREGGVKRHSQATRSLPTAIPHATRPHRFPAPPPDDAPSAPAAQATDSRGLTPLALVPGAEASAATPEQLTERLRTF